jgi:betaine-aldehyde dehydrogenase
VERYVALALEEGGKLLCGGKRGSDGRGYHYEPTIFEGLPNTSRTCQEEIFGPVLCLLPWEDEADLIVQANANDYGLACGIWSADYKTALRLGQAITAGTIWVNTYKLFSISTPFTGYKMSGLGKEKGAASIMEYMMQKSFYWGTNAQPLPWSQT